MTGATGALSVPALPTPAAATLLALAVAAVLEGLVGEPPECVHPVAWLGRLVAPADRPWRHPELAGFAVALGVPLLAAVAAAAVVWSAAVVDPWLGGIAAGLVLFVASSLRRLLSTATVVIRASDGDTSRAREELPALVGRDPSTLSVAQVRSAAVESAAENLSDGLVAPLFAFVAGAVAVGTAVAATPAQPEIVTAAGLAGGSAAGAWIKAVNTLDSMLGYPDVAVGRAPARLDDLAMCVPARLTGVLLAVASGRPGAVASARRFLSGVPSPNAGWPMGVAAAAHDLRLEKPGVYVLAPGGATPTVARARRAVRSVAIAGGGAYLLAGLAVLAWGVASWR